MRNFTFLSIFVCTNAFAAGFMNEGLIDREQLSSDFKRDQRGTITENYSTQKIQLYIKTHKKRYSIVKPHTIQIRFIIANEGFYPVTLYVYKNYLKNFTLVARRRSGHSLPTKDINFAKSYERDDRFQNYTGTAFHSRVVTLQPGESFTRVAYLDDLVDLSYLKKEKNRISLFAYFYPNPVQNPKLFVKSSNEVSLLLDQKLFNDLNYTRRSNRPTLESSDSGISPKEIVFLALSAEYMKNWKSFFKYVSLRHLIKDFPEFAREYQKSPDHLQSEVLEKFRHYLKSRKTHKLMKFKIKYSDVDQIKKNIAQVRVSAVRKIDGFQREFSYTYYLTMADFFWKITSIEATLVR